MEQTDDLPVRVLGSDGLHAGHNVDARPDEVPYGVEAVQRVQTCVVSLPYAKSVIGLRDARIPQLQHLAECEVAGVHAEFDVIGQYRLGSRDGVEEVVQLDVVYGHQGYRVHDAAVDRLAEIALQDIRGHDVIIDLRRAHGEAAEAAVGHAGTRDYAYLDPDGCGVPAEPAGHGVRGTHDEAPLGRILRAAHEADAFILRKTSAAHGIGDDVRYLPIDARLGSDHGSPHSRSFSSTVSK